MPSWPPQYAGPGAGKYTTIVDANEPTEVTSSNRFSIPRKPIPVRHEFEVAGDDIKPIAGEWRPLYLRRRVLIFFALLFCCLIVAIEGLYIVSRQGHGLASTLESRYYLWKYGPTAVVVVIAAFWARVTYQAKLAAPWIEFQSGSIAPELTVLLDYISLPEPTVLVRSFQKRSLVVTAAVSGSLLLKILFIFSAGLITLDKTNVRHTNVALTVRDAFVNDNKPLNHSGSIPWYVLNGVLVGTSSYASGTNEKYAYQMIDTSNIPPGSRVEGIVDAFVASLDCEDATIIPRNWTVVSTYNPKLIARAVYQSVDFSTSGCYAKNFSMISSSLSQVTDLTAPIAWSRFLPVRCDGQSGGNSNRILVSAGQLSTSPEQIVQGTKLNTTGYSKNATWTTGTASFSVQKSVNFICTPKYDIVPLKITVNSTGAALMPNVILEPLPGLPNKTLDSVSGWDVANSTFLAQYYISALSSYIPQISYDGVIYMNTQIAIGMNIGTSTLLSIDDLMSPAVLRNVTTKFYQAYTAQIVHSALMSYSNSSITGTAITYDDRLVLRSVSARAMEAIFALLVLVTIWMAIKVPKSFLPSFDPSTLIGIASILSRSHKLVSVLQDKSSEGEVALKRKLQFRSFTPSTESSLRNTELSIETSEDDHMRMRLPQSQVAKFLWWQPVPNRLWAQIMASIAVIGVIVGLEIVLRLSQKHHSLGDVSNRQYFQYLWTYVPALVMVLISIYFSALDSSIRTLVPYMNLREGANWTASMCLNLVDGTSIWAVTKSLKTKNYKAVLTTVAAILGSLLIILISSVYTTQTPLTLHNLVLNRDTWFSYNYDSTQLQTETAEITAGLILDTNMPYPQWTYEELAFTSFSISPNRTNETLIAQAGPMKINLNIPAMRSAYQCRLYTQDHMTVNLTWGRSPYGRSYPNNTLVAIIPAERCGPSTASNSTSRYSNTTSLTLDEITPFYTSAQPNTHFGYGAIQSSIACSDYTYWWGYTTATGVQSITALGCNETIQEVLANATFTTTSSSSSSSSSSISQFYIDTTCPSPAVIESTAKLANINQKSMLGVGIYTDSMPDLFDDDLLDPFFSTIIYGKQNLPISLLNSNANTDQETIQDSIIHLMRIIKAQQIHSILRAPTSRTNATSTTLPATAISTSEKILIQSLPSTRVVQVLLGVMLLLAILSKILVRTSRVLPFTPTSIANMGALVADSNLLDIRVFAEGIRGIEERESASIRKGRSRSKNENGQGGEGGNIYRLGWFDPQGYSLGWRAKGGGAGTGKVVFTVNAVERDGGRREGDGYSLNSLGTDNRPLLGTTGEEPSGPRQ